MFLKTENNNLSEREIDKRLNQMEKAIEKYIQDIVLPDYIAFCIAYGFKESCMFENDFDIIITTALDLFNFEIKIDNKLKEQIKNVLLIRYGYKIINHNPLKLN